MQRTAIHITKEASNTRIEECEFEGFDLAIKNEGKGTKVLNSIFKSVRKIWYEHFFVRLLVEVLVGLVVVYLAYKFGWNK